jgi:FkbM family methyltransferase
MANRPMTEKVLIGLALAVCVFAATGLALNRPEAPYFVLSMTGRMHPGCGARATYQATMYERSRQDARESVARASTLLQREDGLALWKSPHGQAWIQDGQGEWAPFWAGDLHHWPPRWAQLEVVPVVPVGPGSIVIDAGGHIGESANRAIQMGAKLVVSIEPDPLNAKALRRNLGDAIRDGRLMVIEKALLDTEGRLTLERHDASTRTTVDVAHEGDEGIEVPMTTLDQIVRDLNLSRIDFIKMDIEGAEQHALRGARETLERHQPILAIGAYHRPDDVEEIPKIVLGLQPKYTMTPLRCLLAGDRVIPHLLYFHVPGRS